MASRQGRAAGRAASSRGRVEAQVRGWRRRLQPVARRGPRPPAPTCLTSPAPSPDLAITPTRADLRYRHLLLSAADSDEWEDGEDESAASWGMPKECYGGGNFSETADKACSSDSSLMRKAIDLPPPPWLASLSPRLHLPPDLDARHFDVCVLYLLAAHDVFVERAQMIHISQRKHGRAQGPEEIRGLGVLEG